MTQCNTTKMFKRSQAKHDRLDERLDAGMRRYIEKRESEREYWAVLDKYRPDAFDYDPEDYGLKV